jgi:hypothetical protein
MHTAILLTKTEVTQKQDIPDHRQKGRRNMEFIFSATLPLKFNVPS